MSGTRLTMAASGELLPDPLPGAVLDLDYLQRAGLAARVPHWRELAARQFHHSAT